MLIKPGPRTKAKLKRDVGKVLDEEAIAEAMRQLVELRQTPTCCPTCGHRKPYPGSCESIY